MKNRILVSLILFFSLGQTHAQEFNPNGYPLITNYSAKEIGILDQGMSITQDKRGVMYFGTWENGILEYDGVSWRKIAMPENNPVLSMATGDDGTVYVGSYGDFGFLEPNEFGELRYVSLLPFVVDSLHNRFDQIYKTYFHNGKSYFCSTTLIFIYDGQWLETIATSTPSDGLYPFLSFIVKDTFYIGTYGGGLYIIEQGKLKPAPGAEKYKGKNIFSMLEQDDGRVLIVTNRGVFLYNPETGESTTSLNEQTCNLIGTINSEGGIPYYSVTLDNNHTAIGFLESEWVTILEFDNEFAAKSLLNKRIGLQGNAIFSLFHGGVNHPLWAGFYDNGISKIETSSSIRRFGTEIGLNQPITDIIRFNGTLYISTMNGVFYLQHDALGMPVLHQVKNLTGTVWSLIEFRPPNGRPMLLAGSYMDGLFEIKDYRAHGITKIFSDRVATVQHNIYSLYQSDSNPETLYLGLKDNLAALTWTPRGWKSKTDSTTIVRFNNTGINYDVREMAEDAFGNLWIRSVSRGLKVISSENKLIDFANHPDLDNSKDITFLAANDTLFFISDAAIYNYNYKDSSFVKGGLVAPYSKNRGFRKIQQIESGFVASCVDDNTGTHFAQFIERDENNEWEFNPTPFKRLPNKPFDAIYVDDKDGTVWLGLADELFNINPYIKPDYTLSYPALIRKVIAKDSLIFNGTFYSLTEENKRVISTTQQQVQIPKLPFTLNALEIQFSSPFFEREEDMVFSHYLEGSDEVTWSKWDPRKEAIYTNLKEGKYTFHVKAKNIYDQESTSASFSFEIYPPWYRTIVAFIIYGLLVIAFMWAIVKWNTRRLEEEKKRLEEIVRERTAEVVAQKEEIETQSEMIATQNEEIKSSIQYASRIQSAILTPAEVVNTIFPENFILYLPRDIVSGDFYYITQIGNKKVCVVADCTGHGVPGGFMSMLGISFLNQIISQSEEVRPATILNKLRQQVISALHQTSEIGGSKDGMDLALFILDETTMTVEFAGANNPLIHIRDGEVSQIKGDKMPIGIHVHDKVPFQNVEIEVKKGDVLYAFSDGYADQFGGPLGRKFMTKTLRELLLQIHQKPMAEQLEILNQTLLDWHGDTPRIDDVVIMGVRV